MRGVVMSRVFQALEKAEQEKNQRGKENKPVQSFETKAVLKKEVATLKFPEPKIEEFGLPLKEETPVLIVPPHSFAGEEFRKLKAQIFQKLPNPPHTILVTSAAPGEGKTMVAVNLAMAISQEIHRKAVLVDVDLRKPSIHLERSQSAKGLVNYLSDGTGLSEILIDSEMENLKIIMAGASSKKSSELVGSKKMGEFLKSLSESEDNSYVILDSPPIVSTTEPILLSRMVDGIVFVIMADRTPKQSVSRSIKSIDRQKIIGVVFNQIDLKPTSYYSKYYYKYYRPYGH